MFEKLKKALQKGEHLDSPSLWARRALFVQVASAFLSALLMLGKALGIDFDLDSGDIDSIANGLVFVGISVGTLLQVASNPHAGRKPRGKHKKTSPSNGPV